MNQYQSTKSIDIKFEILLQFISALWPRTNENKYCTSHQFANQDEVENQKSCQHQCEQVDDCVGITYSNKPGNSRYCYICLGEDLQDAANGFSFYKRQGINVFHTFLFMFLFAILPLCFHTSAIFHLKQHRQILLLMVTGLLGVNGHRVAVHVEMEQEQDAERAHHRRHRKQERIVTDHQHRLKNVE